MAQKDIELILMRQLASCLATPVFLVDPKGRPYFLEVNARLQVEHPVTEMRTGLDLVQEQIRVAAGHRLSFTQDDVTFRGHAIECRINAEDPAHGFKPAPGTITKWAVPALPHLRVETHVETGYEVPPFYDSMICKLVAWGETRDQAADRMLEALGGLVCEGVPTTVPLHRQVLASREFRESRYTTRAIPGFTPPKEH